MEVNETVRSAGAALFAVDPDSFRSLNGNDGAVYVCRRGDRAYVIKFIPVQVEHIPQYAEKLAFVNYLAKNGVLLAYPILSEQEQLFECLEVNGQNYLVIVTPFAKGKHVNSQRTPNEWNGRLFYNWGNIMGKMHALARRYPKWQRMHSENAIQPVINNSFSQPAPVYDGQTDTYIVDWQMEHTFFQHWSMEPEVIKRWLPLAETLKHLPITRASYGLIHNDLHHWNFLYDAKSPDGETITIIDFDVCTYHWFITDITIALHHAMSESAGKYPEKYQPFAQMFLQSFMKGYNEENQLDSFWWRQLNTFLTYRQILTYTAMSNSWPEKQRNPWQAGYLKQLRRAILSDTPVLPEAFVAQLG